MHRHLLGLKSPPTEFIADRFLMTATLPEHWDGDSWVKADGRSYFLRAWNTETGRIAYGEGSKFEEARQRLLLEVIEGTRRVKILLQESKPA